MLRVVLAGEASFFLTWNSTALSEDLFSLNVGSSAKTGRRQAEAHEVKLSADSPLSPNYVSLYSVQSHGGTSCAQS